MWSVQSVISEGLLTLGAARVAAAATHARALGESLEAELLLEEVLDPGRVEALDLNPPE